MKMDYAHYQPSRKKAPFGGFVRRAVVFFTKLAGLVFLFLIGVECLLTILEWRFA